MPVMLCPVVPGDPERMGSLPAWLPLVAATPFLSWIPVPAARGGARVGLATCQLIVAFTRQPHQPWALPFSLSLAAHSMASTAADSAVARLVLGGDMSCPHARLTASQRARVALSTPMTALNAMNEKKSGVSHLAALSRLT